MTVQADLSRPAPIVGFGHLQRVLKESAFHCGGVRRFLPAVVNGSMTITAILGGSRGGPLSRGELGKKEHKRKQEGGECRAHGYRSRSPLVRSDVPARGSSRRGEPLAALPPSAILLQIGVSGEKFTRYVLPAKSRFKWRAEMLCRTRKSELRVPVVFEAVHGGACGGELFGQARRVGADLFLELQHDG